MRLGQGILSIAFEKLPTLLFYSDTSDKKPVKSIQVIKDKDGEYAIKNKEQTKWFAPEGMWLDYSIFVVRVDTTIGNWYRVFVNEKQTLWTKVDSTKNFKPWGEFLISRVTSITKRKGYVLLIKAAPTDTAKTIKTMEDEDCFQILDMKGDWLKVKTHEALECDGSKKKIKSGWLRWRQDNHLTIEYGLTC